ncbi:hypothetical protein PRIC1_000441 [Phytophthora ramorum]
MTKAAPPRRLLLKKCDGNQEDVNAFDPSSRSTKAHFPLQQEQSSKEDADPFESRRACRHTSLEELLDLELDLILPVTAIPAPTSNQLPVCAANEELEADVDSVSLELLAMQSPHGENQQWLSEEDEQDANSVPSVITVRPEEQSPRPTVKGASASRKPMALHLVSPTAFVPSFPPSPSQSSTDEDYGLASPMALPDTPSQSQSGITLTWDLAPTSPTYEDTYTRAGTSRGFAQSKSVQRPERRTPRFSAAARAATPNPRNHGSYAPDRATARITRSALPTLPEGRGKARHGGIYSLLLKNKSGKQEPMLVEDAHNSDGMTQAPSVSKASACKQKHGERTEMNRIFGKKKAEAPSVNVSDVGGKVDARITDLDMKIEKLDQELRKHREQMKKTRGPALNTVKQRAMQTLKRKKMFEAQRDKLTAQSFNIEQASFAIDTSRDTISTVAAMKSAAVQLKAETQKIDISELEDVQDDMADLMEDMNEIQEIMGRSYGIGDEIDEDELEAELEGLEEEWAEEEALGEEAESAPSYLAPAQHHELPAAPSGILDSGTTARATDEFGLPVASYST